MDRGTVELVDHALGRLLAERGLLGPEQVEAALRLAAGQRLEAVLLLQGWVEPSTLHALRGAPLPVRCTACGLHSGSSLAALEAAGARCGCGGSLVLAGGERGPGGAGSGSGTDRLRHPPWGVAPLATPATGSGSARWAKGWDRPDAPGATPPTSSGSARLIAPAGSGTARWNVGGGAAPGLPPGIGGLCGRYQLLDELGSGGYGVVFRAWDPQAEREVAIKLLTSTSPRAQQRFQREVEATARLQHPNIVPLLDSGEHGGTLYLVMELIRGRTLAERSQGQDRLPLEAAVRVMRDVARAIDHAHREGILHRDLKPHNVIVDPQGRPHVVDFGLAQLEERRSQLTRTGAAVGTPAYMPPEQARSDGSADARSDVYALGATLYHALTGRPPFGGESGPEMLLAIFRQEPDPPSRHDRRVPVDLDTVCLKCLEKSPARRYPGADALAEDLERWLAGQPVRARRPWLVRRAARRLRGASLRHRRRLVRGGLAGALLLMAGGLAVAWSWEPPAPPEPGPGPAPPAATDPQDEAQRRLLSARRVEECQRLLQEAEEHPLEVDVDQVVHRLCREPDPAVATALSERLSGVARALWEVEAEMLLGAGEPDPDEALAGARPLEGLGEALQARQESLTAPLPPAAQEVLKEAEVRLQRRVYRSLSVEARRTPPRLLDIVASRQEGRLGQGRLMVARIACEALGRLAAREGIPGLSAYLLREADPLRALYAARALAQVEDPRVEAPLRAAQARFGPEGLLSEQLRRALERR